VIAVYPFNIQDLSKHFIKDNHFMRNETVLSNQCQEKIGGFTINPSLVNDNYETIIAKLCGNEMLIRSYGVWDVCNYIARADVKDSAIFSDHQQLIIHIRILLAV
jgi:hypothetical protein